MIPVEKLSLDCFAMQMNHTHTTVLHFTSLWNYLEWNGICELNLIHPIVSVPRAPWVFLYTHSHHMWCPCDDMCGLNMDLWKTTHLAFKKQQLPRAVFRAIHIYSHFTEQITRHLTVIRIAYAIFWPNGLATIAYRIHYKNIANPYGQTVQCTYFVVLSSAMHCHWKTLSWKKFRVMAFTFLPL